MANGHSRLRRLVYDARKHAVHPRMYAYVPTEPSKGAVRLILRLLARLLSSEGVSFGIVSYSSRREHLTLVRVIVLNSWSLALIRLGLTCNFTPR